MFGLNFVHSLCIFSILAYLLVVNVRWWFDKLFVSPYPSLMTNGKDKCVHNRPWIGLVHVPIEHLDCPNPNPCIEKYSTKRSLNVEQYLRVTPSLSPHQKTYFVVGYVGLRPWVFQEHNWAKFQWTTICTIIHVGTLWTHEYHCEYRVLQPCVCKLPPWPLVHERLEYCPQWNNGHEVSFWIRVHKHPMG